MKTIFSILFTCTLLFAQAQTANITEVNKAMSLGTKPGLEIIIHKTNVKDVMERYEDKVKFYKGKFVEPGKGGFEYNGVGLKMPAMSTFPVNIVAYLFQEVDNVRMTCFFFGEGYFVTSKNTAQFEQASKFMTEIYNNVQFYRIQEQLEAEEKKLKGLEKDEKNVIGDIKDLENDIQKSRESIAESEGIIRDNEVQKTDNTSRLAAQKAKVAAKEAELKLHNKLALETEMKNLDREIKDLNKMNDKFKSELKDKQKMPNPNTQMISSYTKQVEENTAKIAEKEGLHEQKKAFFEKNVTVREGELKTLNKEREKLEDLIKDNEKAIEKNKSNISEQKSKITTNEGKIKDNQGKQKVLGGDIKNQSDKVTEVKKEQDKYR